MSCMVGAVVPLGSSLSTPPPDAVGVNVLGSSLEWFPLGPPGPPF